MSLIAHYKLDGGAADAVGDNHGTVNGGTTWVSGKLGQAAKFDGSSGYIAQPSVSDYLHNRPEASVAMWVKKDAIQYGFFQLSGYANGNGNLYPYKTSTRVYLDTFRTNRLGPLYMPTSVLEWHHFCVTQKPGEWKLYQNGELVHTAEGNDYISTDYLQFEIGRSSSSRFANGQFDDVCIYDHALSEREVRDLSLGLVTHLKLNDAESNSAQDSEVINEGAVFTYDSTKGMDVFENDSGASRRVRVDNPAHVTKNQTIAMWLYPTSNSRRRNPWNRNYGGEGTITHESSGTLNYYYGTNGGNSPPYQGFSTSSSLPLNQWSHIAIVRDLDAMQLRWYIDGVLDRSTSAPYSKSAKSVSDILIGDGYTSNYLGRISDARQYATALSQDEITELYQQRASIDSEGSIHTSYSVEASSGGNILDYTTWTAGTTGSEVGFSRNGSDGENFRVTDTGPQGTDITVWEARPDSSSGADGGWNGSYYSIDNTKMHRFSVWIRRTVKGNGSAYFGTNGGGSAVLRRTTGASNTNPYFWNGGWGWPNDEWVLHVAHVWPAGSGTGDDHPDSGRYTVAEGRVANISLDYVCASGTTSLRHRSYLYYSTDTSTRQQFCYPRIDVVDGSEPSVEDLLYGLDERWEGKEFPNGFSVNTQTVFPKQSEVGVTRGLIAWYPLIGDTKDYAGTNDAVNNGAVATAEGYEFDGVDDHISLDSHWNPGWSEWTLSMWVKSRDVNKHFHLTGVDTQHPDTWTPLSHFGVRNRVLTWWESNGWRDGSTLLDSNRGYYVCIQFTGSEVVMYLDGKEEHRTTSATNPVFYLKRLGYRGHSNDRYFNGTMKDVRIYNVALTPEEVAMQAKLSLNNNTKVSMTKECVYTQGQFKEVIT